MFRVIVIDDKKGWVEDFKEEQEAIDYAIYLNKLHFRFIAVQNEEGRELISFNN